MIDQQVNLNREGDQRGRQLPDWGDSIDKESFRRRELYRQPVSALGLSHMASKNVRVDSLFLDEGFGTLDEEALNTALETLAGLQQDGKLIGVVFHTYPP